MGRKRKAERQPKPLDSLGSPGVRMRLANANMVAHMLGRQTSRSTASLSVQETVLRKLPCLLTEAELPCRTWKAYDKAFACEWLSEEQMVVGTKCNKLLSISIAAQHSQLRPQLVEVPLPPPPLRPAQLPATTLPETPLRRSRRIAQRAPGPPAAPTGEIPPPVPYAPVPGLSGGVLGVNGGNLFGNCGIHSLAVSPDRDQLASGGANPADCQIFNLSPSRDGNIALSPGQTLVGHDDWVFGSAWVNNEHVVTGSRDETIKLWRVDRSSSQPNMRPLRSQVEVNGRVRDVRYNAAQGVLAALAVNGTVRIWDPHLRSIRTVAVGFDKEVVCMAMDDSLVAVGSQSHVTLVDPRRPLPVFSVESPDVSHGVRSLQFLGPLVSSGSGRGRIGFFDLRTYQHLCLESPEDPHPWAGNSGPPPGGIVGMTPGLEWHLSRRRSFLELGRGWLLRNSVYLEHFEGMDVRNACYAHAWSPCKSHLLTVGGPLAYGLKGSYMALWS